jgi:hypothetical protein
MTRPGRMPTSPAAPETDRMIRFRDHRRASPADRELYARTKRKLAARNRTYMQQYADAKIDVVSVIMSPRPRAQRRHPPPGLAPRRSA